MNWTDFVVMVIIASFAVIGLYQGFVLSLFKIASFFISVFIAVKFYPVVVDIIMKTSIYADIKLWIMKNLLKGENGFSPDPNTGSEGMSILEKIHLPGFIREMISEGGSTISEAVNYNDAADKISSELTTIIISIISVIVLYMATRLCLLLLRSLFKGIARLPVFKQLDKAGGLILGGLEGMLTVYLVLAVVMLFSSSPAFTYVFESIEDSQLAVFFFENNFIVDMVF